MEYFEWFAQLIKEYKRGPRLDNFIQGVIALVLSLFVLLYMSDDLTSLLPAVLGGGLFIYSLTEIIFALFSKGEDPVLVRIYKKIKS